MTAEDHLKNATSELTKAAEILKQDISQLHTDESNLRKMMNLQLAQLAEELKVAEQQKSQVHEPTQIQRLQQRIADVHNRINQKKRDMDNEVRRISELVMQKQKDLTAIQDQARMVAP